jgi:hypothetical protein
MFNFKNQPQDVALDKAISDLLEELNSMEGSNEDYAATADNLIKLMKLKKDVIPSWRPSPDVIVNGAVSLLGILCILNFERAGIVTSKAISFVTKMR